MYSLFLTFNFLDQFLMLNLITVTVMINFKDTSISIIPCPIVNSYHLPYSNLFHTYMISLIPFHINSSTSIISIRSYNHSNISIWPSTHRSRERGELFFFFKGLFIISHTAELWFNHPTKPNDTNDYLKSYPSTSYMLPALLWCHPYDQ